MQQNLLVIGSLHDPVTWYRIYYRCMLGCKLHSGIFRTKESRTGLIQAPLFWKIIQLCYLCPNIIYSVPCDWIVQQAYYHPNLIYSCKGGFLSWSTMHVINYFALAIGNTSTIQHIFNNYSMSVRWIWVGYNQSHIQQARME